MSENTYKTLGDELSFLYNNSVLTEEYIFHYLDFTIPDILREAAKAAKKEKKIDTETIMWYRRNNQNFKIDDEFYHGWKPVVEKWAHQNGLEVQFNTQTTRDITVRYTIFSW